MKDYRQTYVAFLLCLFGAVTSPAVIPSTVGAAAKSGREQATTSAAHQAQAAQYHRRADQLQAAIEHYRLLAEVYAKGSQDRHPGFNPQGRAAMVRQATRVMQYFMREQQRAERLALFHEQIAQFARITPYPPLPAPPS